MLQRQSTWTASRGVRARRHSRRLPVVRIPSISNIRAEINPIGLIRSYPLVIPTILLALSALMYMLQVNEGQLLDLRLQSAQSQQAQQNGIYAQLAVQMDKILSCNHICPMARNKLDMARPGLRDQIGISVRIPRSLPRLPRQPVIHTGALWWMDQALKAVEGSL